MANSNKIGGRPPKKQEDKKSHHVSTRLNDQEYEELKRKSADAKLQQSDYIRKAIARSVVVERLDRDFVRLYMNMQKDLREIGRRINTVCFMFEHNAYFDSSATGREIIKELRNLIEIYGTQIKKK